MLNSFLARLKSIKPGTWIRTAALIIALANQACNQFGWTPLPVGDHAAYNDLSWLLTAVTGVAAWWKNNSFTDAAIEADGYMNKLKNEDQ